MCFLLQILYNKLLIKNKNKEYASFLSDEADF